MALSASSALYFPLPSQKLKVAHIQLGIDPDELVIAHGTSRFLPAQKYQDLVRKKRSGAREVFFLTQSNCLEHSKT